MPARRMGTSVRHKSEDKFWNAKVIINFRKKIGEELITKGIELSAMGFFTVS